MKSILWKIAILFILGQFALAQEYAPAASFYRLLKLQPSVKGDQPTWAGGVADILFAPAGDFSAKVQVKSGQQVLAEFPTRIERRVGTIARIRWKYEFVPLGTSAGPRSVDILVNDQLCGRLNFEVIASGGGDAFDRQSRVEVIGPWASHGQFYYESDPANQQRVHFVYWAQRRDLGGPAKGMVDLVMRRGQTILATAKARETSYLEYLQRDQELFKPNGKVLTAKDLHDMTGPFTLELKLGSKVIRSFRGSIADGKFTPHARSEPSLADRTQFLSPREMNEGGGSLSTQVYTWVTTD